MLTWSALAPALLAAAMYVGCGGSSPGDQPTDNDASESVAGELLVGVRASLSDQVGLETKLASVADVTSVSESVYRLQLHAGITQEQAVAQLVHPDILYVEPNYVVHVYAAPADSYWTVTSGPQYGAALKAEMESAWAAFTSDGTFTTSSPLKVALLDTGVRVSNAEFGASAVKLSLTAAKNEITGVTYTTDATSIADDNGHGTACASIIVGAAGTTIGSGTGMVGVTSWNNTADPKIIKVIPFKVLDANGKGNHANIAQGIADAITAGAKVISMSFGGAAPSWTLQNAIQQAKTAGVLVVAAAGNDGKSVMRYPAAYQTANQLVLSVGSTDNTDTLSPDSNYGTWVNVLAPGAAINAVGTGTAVGLWAADSTADGALTQTMSGTSLSTAFVSGLAAMAWAKNHSMTAAEIRTLITTSVDSFDRATGKAIAVGGGRVNPLAVASNVASPFSRVLGAVTFPGVSAASGKGAITATVTLTAVQSGDTTITLASNNTAVAVPGTVKVLAGKTSATFTATIGAVASDTTVTITATNGSESTTAKLLVAQPAVSAVTLAASAIAGGASTTGRVVLNTAPPKTGSLAVTLSASSTSVHFASTTVTVAGGSTAGAFSITTDPVTTSTAVTITATDANAKVATAVLTLTPPVVSNFTLAKATITFGTTTGTVTLNAKAPTGGKVVTLSSSDGLVAVPASVTVLAGATTATFTVTPEPATVLTSVVITATTGSTSKTATIKVNPPLATLAVGTATIAGAGTTTATVTLSDSAPSAIQVGITSDQTRVTLSGSAVSGSSPNQVVTIAQGAKTATFTVNVAAGTGTIAAVIAATYQGVIVTKTVTASAPTLSAFTCPSGTPSGNTITCTVTLGAAAPVDMDVTLATTSATYLPVPSGSKVTVATGSTSNTFSVAVGSPTSATTYTYTATVNGSSKTASVKITPSGVTLSNLALDYATRVGGLQNAVGTITLSGNAPTGGITVTLSSDQTGGATVPVSASVAGGSSTGTFTVTTKAQNAALTAFNINAVYSGTTKSAALTVNPTITAVTPASATPLAYGATSTGNTVTVGAANGTGSALAVTATLVDATTPTQACADTNSTVAAAVSPLQVNTSATASNVFTVTNANTSGSTATCKVKASITIAGVTVSALSSTITLASQAAFAIQSVAVDHATRVGGLENAQGTVTMNRAAASDTTVTLTSAQTSAATVPASVTVLSGSATATFTITTLARAAALGPFNITGTYNAVPQTASLTVNPTISAVTPASATPLAYGATSTGNTVTLGAANGTGSAMGVTVSLVDSADTSQLCADTNSTVAAAVGQLQVATSATASNVFTVTNANTSGSSATCKVKASVTLGGVTVSAYSATITLASQAAFGIQSVALDHATRVGGLENAQGTVTMSRAAASDITVSLSSAQTGAATVPVSVTVSSGSATATFAVTTKARTAALGPFNISGTYNGVTQSDLLTVNPTISAVTPASPTVLAYGGTILLNKASLGVANGTGSALDISVALKDSVDVTQSCADTSSTVVAAAPPLQVADAATDSNVFTVTNANVSGSAALCVVEASVTIGGITAKAYSAVITLTSAVVPTLQSVGLDYDTRIGGLQNGVGTVTLTSAAVGDTVVTLSSAQTDAATVPASVTVVDGATTANFAVTTKALTSAIGPFNITGTLNAVSQHASLTVNPTLSAVTPGSPTILAFGDTSTGNKATLSIANGTGSDLTVTLSLVDATDTSTSCVDTNSTVVAAAPPLKIPTTATDSNVFTVANGNVTGSDVLCRVKASVTIGGVTASVYSDTITLTSATVPALATFDINPQNPQGGLEYPIGTVTLDGPAVGSGSVVYLQSGDANATVPASITIPAGQSSGQFTVTTLAVAATTSSFDIDASLDHLFATKQTVTMTYIHSLTLQVAVDSTSLTAGNPTTTGRVANQGTGHNTTGSPIGVALTLVDATDTSSPCGSVGSTVTGTASIADGTGTSTDFTVTISDFSASATCKVEATITLNGVDTVVDSGAITITANQ